MTFDRRTIETVLGDPLTEERVREIVREEIDKAIAQAPAFDVDAFSAWIVDLWRDRAAQGFFEPLRAPAEQYDGSGRYG